MWLPGLSQAHWLQISDEVRLAMLVNLVSPALLSDLYHHRHTSLSSRGCLWSKSTLDKDPGDQVEGSPCRSVNSVGEFRLP